MESGWSKSHVLEDLCVFIFTCFDSVYGRLAVLFNYFRYL